MGLVQISAPEAEPLTLAEVRTHLRVNHETENELLEGLIRGARQEVERATGLALIAQSWRLTCDGWPRHDVLMLPKHPVREVLAVTVHGADGGAALIGPGDYEADLISRPARLYLHRRPKTLRALNGLEADFSAGFGEAGTDVPDLLKRAMLLLVGHWFDLRGVAQLEGQAASYPPGYDRLIAGYRQGRL